jgi:hypothetical protein
LAFCFFSLSADTDRQHTRAMATRGLRSRGTASNRRFAGSGADCSPPLPRTELPCIENWPAKERRNSLHSTEVPFVSTWQAALKRFSGDAPVWLLIHSIFNQEWATFFLQWFNLRISQQLGYLSCSGPQLGEISAEQEKDCSFLSDRKIKGATWQNDIFSLQIIWIHWVCWRSMLPMVITK